jgi:hypothetical protein
MPTIGQAFKPVLLASILARNREAGIREWDMGKGNMERELEVSRIGKWKQKKFRSVV